MTRGSWPVRFAKTTGGADLAVLVKPGGCSPPFLVVCPLGTPARASSELIPAVAEFCDAFLAQSGCFEFEWRGTGVSATLDSVLTMEDLAADIAATADAIGQPFHLLAFGAAAIPALLYASSQPRGLLGVLLDTPRTTFPLRHLAAMDDSEYDRALATHLRLSYDFPPAIVAQELVPSYRADVPRALVEAWSSAWDAFTDLDGPLARVVAPVLLYTTPAYVPEAAELARRLPVAETVVARALAANALRASALRREFETFWSRFSCEHAPVRESNLLSARELEVLGLLAAGKSNRQIAEVLVLSEATVATHVRHILEKTGSANRAEAVAYAVRNGLA